MDDLIKTAAEAAEDDALPRMHEVHSDPEAHSPVAMQVCCGSKAWDILILI